MHLTNYAINKESENFVQARNAADDSTGSKRSLQHVIDSIAEEYSESYDKVALAL